MIGPTGFQRNEVAAESETALMDMATVLREVDSWSVEERIRLVEAVWERIIEGGAIPELTEAQRVELDRRLAALETAPDDVVPWEGVQEHVRRPR